MSKIIDFEKKRREKLSSFDQFSKGQKYLRGERIRKENNLSHRENEAVKKDLAKTSKEEMLIELYIVETIEKLRNLYVMIAIFSAISSVSITSWSIHKAADFGDMIPGFTAGVALAYLAYVMVIKAMGEHYFKRRFRKSFSNLLDHLEEHDLHDEASEDRPYEDYTKEMKPPAP